MATPGEHTLDLAAGAGSAGDLFDDVADRGAELELCVAGASDVAYDGEHHGARRVPGPQRPVPLGAVGQYVGHCGEGLDVVDDRRVGRLTASVTSAVSRPAHLWP